METKTKKQVKSAKNQKVTKLSKIGKWLESGKSIGGTYDIKAIML